MDKKYCAPADTQNPKWLLIFDDINKSDGHYKKKGDAMEAFKRAEELGWNCYLYELVEQEKE